MVPPELGLFMRALLLIAALALAGCGQQGATATAEGCARSATHEVAWTSAEARDVITTRSDGPSCSQAVVTFVARNAQGDALWAFASTYYDLTAGGTPPEGAPPVTAEQMDTFLAGWANVTEMRSSELPEWRADAETLSASAQTFSYDTPFDRETYQMLRARNLPMICYAAAVEGTQCLIIDPASHAPIMMVAYGP
jgi:hypothetical protein